MWRSCLRLRGWGRRLLSGPPRGLAASLGSGPNHLPPARAYAPPTERKRFYQNVSITQGEGGFEINLDHRKLKTPQAKLFTVPSEALAIAVATEWDSQKDTIKFYTMHLTTLCNTSLDNPTQRSKEQLIQAAVKFLDTDTICYRVEEPETLVELQKNEWDPVVAWAEKRSLLLSGHSRTGTHQSPVLSDTALRSAPPPASWDPASRPGHGKCLSATWHLTTCGPCKGLSFWLPSSSPWCWPWASWTCI
ncbi:ATP synthase mitochondrial F1 complex assembly factor 2 isoform X4 [Tamandua tetradactyla]|uniref:ATP synthase mitochondrial F1 complex assembly factor 2 isoform X4 n=1 Tax=Tamandua tetradactyla TaxID=48850 RepID=UPI0040540B9E